MGNTYNKMQNWVFRIYKYEYKNIYNIYKNHNITWQLQMCYILDIIKSGGYNIIFQKYWCDYI